MIDNTACSSIIGNAMLSPKVKHVVVRFHCVWGWVRAEFLSPIYINTTRNLGDISTKPLAGFKDKVQQIMISMISDYMDIIRPHPNGVGNA
ncbi:hypothetical protein CYMTET_7869 [Cymbomonas tetramitiformis]|uniref:Uncharacterized protein n=1 Tax=Cymbomonas tetramitiformis TaxID=36881 RepID=A0AAE0GUD8_9CHLO|nr:hypothetical protein CYMTET_7869 [Cymbomonas tetramitiformis]